MKICVVLLLLWSVAGQSEVLVETNLGYATSVVGNPVQSQTSLVYTRSAAYLSPAAKSPLFFGLGLLTLNQSVKTTEEEVISVADYLLSFKYIPFSSRWLSLGLSYAPSSKATFKDGTNPTETWSGSSFIFSTELRLNQSGWFLGVGLDYYSAIYSQKTVSGTTSSTNQSSVHLVPFFSVARSF
jgi:hypothetical protein